MQVILQRLPDRLDDFVLQYKNEKRKSMDALTYTISDYLIGIKTTRGYETVVDGKSAYPKFETQLSILKSAETRFKNVIFDISEVLQADIFDSEIEAAKELNKKGFIMAQSKAVIAVLATAVALASTVDNAELNTSIEALQAETDANGNTQEYKDLKDLLEAIEAQADESGAGGGADEDADAKAKAELEEQEKLDAENSEIITKKRMFLIFNSILFIIR